MTDHTLTQATRAQALPPETGRLYALKMTGGTREPPAYETGLKQLLAEMRSELIRFMLARNCDPADADDLYQDLYLKLTNARTGPVSNPRAYLYQTANNLLHDRRRGRQRQESRDDHWARNRFGHDLERDPEATPEQTAIDRDELARVEQALASMPPRTAEILKLYRVEGKTQKSIAEMLGLSVSAVEKHLQRAYRALMQLRSELNAEPGRADKEDDHVQIS